MVKKRIKLTPKLRAVNIKPSQAKYRASSKYDAIKKKCKANKTALNERYWQQRRQRR